MGPGLFSSPGLRALEGRLADLIAGRAVLAQQIANIDTPGYSGADTASFQAVMASAVAAQLGGQLPGTGEGGTVATVPLVPPAGGGGGLQPPVNLAASGGGTVTPDGNGMDFDALMVDLAKTSLDYQAIARQLQLTFANLTDAIDAGR